MRTMLHILVPVAFASAGLAAGPAFARTPSKDHVCAHANFQQVKEIPVKDFGTLANQEIVRGNAGAIMLWYFDVDDQPLRQGYYAAGIVLARVGDIGEQPVVGYIWIPEKPDIISYEDAKSGSNEVSADLSYGKASASCPAGKVRFTLTSDGKFFVDGKLIDQVRQGI